MVGINYDLTKYLPDSSPSAQALDLSLIHILRVIAVDDNKAVHRGQLGKLVERVDDIVDILEAVSYTHLRALRSGFQQDQ